MAIIPMWGRHSENNTPDEQSLLEDPVRSMHWILLSLTIGNPQAAHVLQHATAESGSMHAAGPAQCMAITPTWGRHSEKDTPDEQATHWILLSGHETGIIQLWANHGECMVPLARLTSQTSPCR